MDNSLKLYIQLLKYDISLRQDGTCLEEQDRDKYLKLLNYSIKLSDHIHWRQKPYYLNIMEDFVDLKIDANQFVSQFYKLHNSNEEAVKILNTDLKQLNTFEINPKSFGFTEFTSGIDVACDDFYLDEEKFRTFVADIIPQIQKY